ncbi:MAG: hypothetical protein KJZ83_00340 [Burkholderiaceae bacterium]|nr:hypothetical protein [Burkholderiaceae bacterium]
MNVLLTRRAVVQAAIEATYGDPEAMTPDDGVLVSEPTYSIDPNVLERNFTRDSLSQTPHIVGRKLSSMEFTTELRGNGKQNSGVALDAPIIARLFQACGYKLTPHAEPSVKGVFDVGDHATRVAWVPDVTAADNTDAICYYIEVTTAGASGMAEVTITSDTPSENSAAQVITTDMALDVGTHGLILTPTFTGDLAVGQKWVVWLMPPGLSLDPVSDNFESITLVMYKDGVKHVMPGCFGTFEITATAGEFATVAWTFTGLWQQPVDEVMPTPSYERTLPAQVELARLRVGGFYAVVEEFTFDQANDIQVRPDVSSDEGYIGTRLVSRAPEGGINPEADLVASNDFWSQLANADRMPFQMRVGYLPGNTIWMTAPGVQYTGLTYQDRDGILAYDAGLRFPAYDSDDEISFFLC